ncbi:MaoC/PaaZ C-terminal domain-containing protein [Streptomyces jumonjinensis]|uniref:MaoC/PaaZ C-terminal domain-containing protein n=1 Tax=Streptomyces jumonjinensis TaxID=1945 RepID=UPI0037A52B27
MTPTVSPARSHDIAVGTALTGHHLVTVQDTEAFHALCAVASVVPLTGTAPGSVPPAQLASVALRMCEQLLAPWTARGDLVAVHGTQRLRMERAVGVGEPLVSRAVVRSVRPLGAGTATEVSVVFTTDDDSPVAESVSLLVHSARPAAGQAPTAARPAMPPTAPEGAQCSSYTVTRELVRRYAEISGDHNPIHLSPQAARAGGFEDLIAHGMLTFALVAHHVAAAVGETACSDLLLRFSRPLTVPAEGAALTVRGLPAADGSHAVTAVDGAGLLVAGGRAALRTPRPE